MSSNSNPRCFECAGPHLTSTCPQRASKTVTTTGAGRFSSNGAITTGFAKAAPIGLNVPITNLMLNRSVSQIPQQKIGSTINPGYIPPTQFTQSQSADQFSRKRSKSNGTSFIQGKTENILHLSQDPTKRKLPNMIADDMNKRQRPEDTTPVQLSPEQANVMKCIMAGQSVFFTGPAGTGKSFLLQQIIKNADKETTFVTASTGLAAVSLGGTTIHSFAGIGLGKGSKEDVFNHCAVNHKAKTRWKACKMLIIDEVSMIDADLFDKLEYVATRTRRVFQPFGGIQLVMTGDFLQLPPVPNEPGIAARFAFEAAKWNECCPNVIMLDMVFRQQDNALVSMLSSIRSGNVTDAARQAFQSCIGRRFDTSDGIEATRLHCRKVQVNAENVQRLTKLTTETYVYHAHSSGTPPYLDSLNKNCPAADTLELKIGAQVMLLKNLDVKSGLVNGSRGVIIAYHSGGAAAEEKKIWKHVNKDARWPVVRFTNGAEQVIEPHTWETLEKQRQVAARTQVPLMLAWSLTVHKCQGMTLDRVELDLTSVFEVGQAYVALSRIRSLNSLSLVSFPAQVIRAHAKALQFYEQLKEKRARCQPQSMLSASTIAALTSGNRTPASASENNPYNAYRNQSTQSFEPATSKVEKINPFTPSQFQSSSSTCWSSSPASSSTASSATLRSSSPSFSSETYSQANTSHTVTKTEQYQANTSFSASKSAPQRGNTQVSSSSPPSWATHLSISPASAVVARSYDADVVDLLSDDDNEELLSKSSSTSSTTLSSTSPPVEERRNPYLKSSQLSSSQQAPESPPSLEQDVPLMPSRTSNTNLVAMPMTLGSIPTCTRHSLPMLANDAAFGSSLSRREYRCQQNCSFVVSWNASC